MELRDYQLNCVDSVLTGFNEFSRQLVVMPTGAGKTIVFSHLAKELLPERTLILAHREELIEQAAAKILASTGIQAQVEKADRYASLSAPVVVASIQTLLRRKERWPVDHFGLIVADEAHHSISDSWQSVLSYFQAKILGVTATPDRGDKKNLGKYYENIAYESSILSLIKAGYLSRITVRSIPIGIDLTSVRKTCGDFNDSDLADAITPYLDRIAGHISEIASTRKCLVFLPLINTSKTFTNILKTKGVNAEHIDGTSENRKEILENFAASKFGVLCNAMLLTEGYDCPTVDCVIVLRPTQSRPLFCQMVGRGTRVAPDKKDLLLLDFLWLHEKHNLVRPANLIAKNDEDAKRMTKIIQNGYGVDEMDLQEVEGKATSERENSLREQLKLQAKRKEKCMDAMEFCLSLHDVDLADYEGTMAWHGKEISEGQRNFLLKIGIDPETIKGRGHASAIIDKVINRTKLNLATPKQMLWLQKLGYAKPNEATFEEASSYLDSRFNRKAKAAH